MPVTPTYPGVYVEEIPSGVRTITGVSTSVAAFIDFFKRGPLNKAVQLFSMGDFGREFGGLDANSEASYAIQQFFLNGGTEAWAVRVASGTPATLAKATAVLRGHCGRRGGAHRHRDQRGRVGQQPPGCGRHGRRGRGRVQPDPLRVRRGRRRRRAGKPGGLPQPLDGQHEDQLRRHGRERSQLGVEAGPCDPLGLGRAAQSTARSRAISLPSLRSPPPTRR